ncbi:MAG: A/G-specific adenine glycosylase [Prolixibacteraceae bacterium]
MVDVGVEVLRWYAICKRDLPWRETKDPYAVWLSEIILQQTRVDQGLSYYLRFLEKYPTVAALAKANEDDILKLWQGLGYYSRARNLHATARMVTDTYGGAFPSGYDELIRLKGIGEYTAAAIASISFNQPHAVVDGNVYRFLSRLYGISTPIDTPRGKKEFSLLANTLIDRKNPGEYNQAVMEFGALCCTPKKPGCSSCIFSNRCVALQTAMTDQYPVKAGKQKIRLRFFNYLLISDHDHIFIRKRIENDIWKNLYEFPLIETDVKPDPLILEKEMIRSLGQQTITVSHISRWQKQILSHQYIYYRFIYIQLTGKKNELSHLLKVNKKDILNFAVPKPIERELERMGGILE